MAEIKLMSKDKIVYKFELQDIIELSTKQRNKLKDLALTKNSNEIETNGLEIFPEKNQEQAIIKKINEIAGHKKDVCQRLMDWVKEVIEKKIVIFSHHAEFDRMPDPTRNCSQKETAVIRLLTAIKVEKFKATIIPGKKEFKKRLTYTTESRIGKGRLAIAFSPDKRILIITVLS